VKLATIRVPGGTRAVRVDADRAVETGHTDVGELLVDPDWSGLAAAAAGPGHRDRHAGGRKMLRLQLAPD